MKTECNSQEENDSIIITWEKYNLPQESEDSTNFLSLPERDVECRSIVSFDLEDGHIREKMLARRSASTRSRGRRPSAFSTITNNEFNQTIGRLGVSILLMFLFVLMLVVYNWWDHIYRILNLF